MQINILKAAAEVLFEPSLTFYSKQSEIGNKIWKKIFPHWETDGRKVIFKNIDKKEICLIDYMKALIVNENVNNISDFKELATNFNKIADYYISAVTDTQLLRIGFRVIAYYNCKLNFQEMVKVFKPKLYPDNKKLIEITNDNYKDVGFSVVYQNNDDSVRLQAGPVTHKELLARTDLSFPLNNEKEIPKDSLFLDIDIFNERPRKDKITKFLDRANKIYEVDLNNFVDYLVK